MMKSLSREQILDAKDILIEPVHVPEWGGTVYVKGLSRAERDAFETSVIETRGTTQIMHLENARAKLCAMSICDEEGNRLFTEADVKELTKKSAVALNRVFQIAQRLSGLGNQAIEELTGEIERPFEDSASG
jgi:hypothetical protein